LHFPLLYTKVKTSKKRNPRLREREFYENRKCKQRRRFISALKRLTRKGRIGFSGRRPYQLKVKALPDADDVPDVGQGLH